MAKRKHNSFVELNSNMVCNYHACPYDILHANDVNPLKKNVNLIYPPKKTNCELSPHMLLMDTIWSVLCALITLGLNLSTTKPCYV